MTREKGAVSELELGLRLSSVAALFSSVSFPLRCNVLQHSSCGSHSPYTHCGLTAATQTHTKIFILVSVYRSCDVRVYGKDSVQYVSTANYSLHKLTLLKLTPQDKAHPCNAHQTPLSFNLVSLYLSPCLQWPCPLALHSPALLSQHQSEVSQ